MENDQTKDITLALEALQKGKVIAYPTEAVYGLGCDPFNEAAFTQLLTLKNRQMAQGVILLVSDWEQIYDLIQPISHEQWAQVNQTWPGAHTWLFPKSERVPPWISGQYESVAIRIPDHPIPRELARRWGKPIVSTSANEHGQAPLKTFEEVVACFGDSMGYVVGGAVGDYLKPSAIQDVLTLTRYR